MENNKEKTADWLNRHWRPFMAYQYAVICLFDFMVAPILLGAYALITKTTLVMWSPLTVIGGGLYHLAMGAVLGLSAWTRGQENIASINTNGVKEKE